VTSQKTKWFNRGFDSALSAVRILIVPIINFVAAYIVIHESGQAVWGQFVEALIFMSLASMFLGFGIKDYVLREASLNGGKLGELVKSGLLVRALILIPCIAIGSLFFPLEYLGWFVCWLFAMLIYNGISPIVNFDRSYKPAILAEVVFGGFLFAYLLFEMPDIYGLIMAFSMAAVLRSLVLLVLFRKPLQRGKAKFDWKLLLAGLPFLAMGFSGMIQSKTDLYLIAGLLGDEDLAVYQVTVNFFVYLQAVSGLALLPFVKNLIRLPEKAILKASLRFGLFGLMILAVSLPVIQWVLNDLYFFGLGIEVMIVGGLLVLPSFIYTPIVYKLIGRKLENEVLYINTLGVVFNLVLSYFLIVKSGIIGGLIGSMIAQWVMFACYGITMIYGKDDR
jgi:O-antigen/teichoic acid export membrane protein